MNALVAFVLFLHRKLGMKRNQLTRIPEGSFQSCGNLGRVEASKSTKFCKKHVFLCIIVLMKDVASSHKLEEKMRFSVYKCYRHCKFSFYFWNYCNIERV